jgi:uncharacterized C2H2 Zn-finger protein
VILDFLYTDVSGTEELELLLETRVQVCANGFVCMICGKTIALKKNLKRHLQEAHMTPVQYRCPPCDKVFVNRAIYKHVSMHHADWKGIDFEKFRILE